MNKTAVGKCGLCGGLVTMPTVWHGIYPPPKTCETCGAAANETANLPTIPMVPRPDMPTRAERLQHALRGAVWMVVGFALIGCAAQPQPAAAQTPTIAERKTALVSYVNASTETRVGQIEQALAPLGYVPPTGPVDPPPQPGRVIFTTTHPSTAQLGGWSKFEQASYPSNGGTASIVEMADCPSRPYAMKLYRPYAGYRQSTASRVHVLHDWTSGSAKPLPNTMHTTSYVFIPQKFSADFLLICGFKQSNRPSRSYIEPSVTCELGPDMTYIRTNIKGATPTRVGAGPVENKIVGQTISPRIPFPYGKWVRIDLNVKHSTGNDGYVNISQDGKVILAYVGKTLREGAADLEYQQTNYSANAPASTLYVDDVTILAP